jgi:hypothetical protein
VIIDSLVWRSILQILKKQFFGIRTFDERYNYRI